MPSFSAAHRPSILLRRAFALKRSSSSWANFFSKPSSRLSKVVLFASQTDAWDRENLDLHIGRKSTNQQSGTRHGAATSWRKSSDCAPHSDPLGCPNVRAGLWLRVSRTARSRRRMESRHQMDFLKPRYTPMSRRRRIYEGKAKVLYEGPEP